MKINKKLRKAFTLVELVVVIAIIAILNTIKEYKLIKSGDKIVVRSFRTAQILCVC